MLLSRFLQKLVNESIIIELKNNTVIKGTVVSVDASMNTTLKNVECRISARPALKLNTLILRGNRIRYFMLPESLNLDSILEQQQRKFIAQQKKSDEKAVAAVAAASRGSKRARR